MGQNKQTFIQTNKQIKTKGNDPRKAQETDSLIHTVGNPIKILNWKHRILSASCSTGFTESSLRKDLVVGDLLEISVPKSLSLSLSACCLVVGVCICSHLL